MYGLKDVLGHLIVLGVSLGTERRPMVIRLVILATERPSTILLNNIYLLRAAVFTCGGLTLTGAVASFKLSSPVTYKAVPSILAIFLLPPLASIDCEAVILRPGVHLVL